MESAPPEGSHDWQQSDPAQLVAGVSVNTVAEAERMIYVVVGDRLLASKRRAMGEHITHAVLADGESVRAAGEFEVIELEGAGVVAALNNVSGHYQPGPESLDAARRAFEARGLRVLPAGVEQYDWRSR